VNPEQIRARVRELLAQRATHEAALSTALATLRGDNVAEQARTDATTAASTARAAIVAVDADLDQQQASLREALDEETRNANAAALRAELGGGDTGGQQRGTGGARVQEARTYRPDLDRRGEVSFFVDAFRATQLGDVNATERLRRHADEVRVEGEQAAERGQQTRAVGTGSFGGLVIPQYLVGLAARVMRGGRPLANAVARLPLPEQGMSLIIPRGTTAATVSSQATENSALSNTDEAWTNLTVPVATIGGQQDVSRQALERGTPGIDQIVYMDLAAQYHAELDRQVAQGSGASGQMLGVLNTAGIVTATAFGAAVTGQNLNTKVAGGIAGVAGAGVGVTPKVLAMHPRRWGYLTSLSDTSGRPLVVPNADAGMNALGASDPGAYSGGTDQTDYRQARPVGSMQGMPVITDANLPTNVGTNLEDVVLVLDNDQTLLWEDGDGMPRQLRFEQTLAQNLTVKLIAYGYAAFTAGRYPQAVARIGGADTAAGNGLVAPTF
jgi:HK97 family phage major capsid protein